MAREPLEIAKTAQELFKPFEICQKEYQKAVELENKILNQNMNISVIGQFKRGKSTMVNAILEDEILPVGIVPVTAVVTEIKYGEKSADIHFENGVVRSVDFEDLHQYINEQENPNNKQGVATVTMKVPSDFLKNGINFVDTPGVGSVHKNNTDAAYAFVKESDAVIFMLSVDSPINNIEIDFLKNAKEYASKFYFAVNKIDTITDEDLQMYLAYCKKLLCDIMEVNDIQIFPISSKTGMGIQALKDTISKDCETSLKEILTQSVRKKLGDLIDGALTQIKLYRNALSMPIEDLDQSFKDINADIDGMKIKVNAMILALEEKQSELKAQLDAELKQFESLDVSMAKDMIAEVYKKYLISLKTWNFIKQNEIEADVNDMKNHISREVSKLFGIDYHYEIEALNFNISNAGIDTDTVNLSGEDFKDLYYELMKEYAEELSNVCDKLKAKLNDKTSVLFDELNNTLNAIFMYREENAYVVVRRIEDLNKLVRHLRSLRVKV